MKLITAYGIDSLPFFNMADKIEDKNGQLAPNSIILAQHLSSLCKYKNAEQDLEFANLCYQYQVPESRFDACLKYMQSG